MLSADAAAAVVGMLLTPVDCCCVAAGEADTKPLNSLLRPKRSWAEAELGTLAADDEAEEGFSLTKFNQDQFIQVATKWLGNNPYALVEFKIAFGHIFKDYLNDYSHWGYTDLDILWGDLQSWITTDEWNDYDIVTYTFGDQNRAYLRGQFTIHKVNALIIIFIIIINLSLQKYTNLELLDS